MGKTDKYVIGIGIAGVFALWLFSRINSAGVYNPYGTGAQFTLPPASTNNTSSTNVPWYLTYNNDPAYYNGGSPPLPNVSAGLANANGSCSLCSLFPVTSNSL